MAIKSWINSLMTVLLCIQVRTFCYFTFYMLVVATFTLWDFLQSFRHLPILPMIYCNYAKLASGGHAIYIYIYIYIICQMPLSRVSPSNTHHHATTIGQGLASYLKTAVTQLFIQLGFIPPLWCQYREEPWCMFSFNLVTVNYFPIRFQVQKW